MKRAKIFFVVTLMIGIGGAIATKANATKNSLFYFNAGSGCVSTTIAPPCPGLPSVICKIGGTTYYGTSVNCGTAKFYTAP
jgi:hypothetical protein